MSQTNPQVIVDSDGQTTVYRVEDTVPAGAGPFLYDIALKPGAYRIGVNVLSILTGTTTQLQAFPHVDVSHATVGNGLSFVELGTSVASAVPALPTAKSGRAYMLVLNPGGTQTPFADAIILLSHGFRLSISKGGAVSGEVLKVDVVVSRADKVSVVPAAA